MPLRGKGRQQGSSPGFSLQGDPRPQADFTILLDQGAKSRLSKRDIRCKLFMEACRVGTSIGFRVDLMSSYLNGDELPHRAGKGHE